VLGKRGKAGNNATDKVKYQKAIAEAQIEGERLFKQFLNEQLTPNDKIRCETEWNAKYNNYLPVDWNKIPVAFTMCKYVKGQREFLDPIKREAVAFMMHTGIGVLSFDVGVGKTPSAIFTLSSFLDAGYCKRPFICVPNQVYKQFITEIKTFTPHISINEAYNLNDAIATDFMTGGFITSVPEGSITMLTYEGVKKLGLSEETQIVIEDGLTDILSQGETGSKARTIFSKQIDTILGKVAKDTIYNIEDFGFDFGVYDEAHEMKKVFTTVKGDATGKETEKGTTERESNPYQISSGMPSAIALKGFALNYYLQKQNKGRNVMLLTATPFTNSPLEVYSMLAMVGYSELEKAQLHKLKQFFDTFVMQRTEYVITANYGVKLKKVITGFSNLIAFQSLIRRFINYKTGEEANVKRPKKYVLPYTKKVDGETIINLSADEKVETYLEMTASQDELMQLIKDYVSGDVTEKELFMADYFQSANTTTNLKGEQDVNEEGDEFVDEEEFELDESDIEDVTEKTAVRILKGLSYGRDLAISPYLMQINMAIKMVSKGEFPSNLSIPIVSPTMFVETSPKLLYAMKCIESVRDYHLAEGTPISGQVLYMDRGVKYFPLLRQYLIDVVGFDENEVAIISSGMPPNGKKSKEYAKNLFNGEIYNESTKLFEPIDDKQRVKVVIGSSTIKEGINLQKYGTVLYNMNLDWNPTDVQQLEGRIYRQGNTFNSVRVVHPLLVNSADIFIFQKLQEKTARINSIWSMDGRTNVLDTTDFDPSELKYTLISDVNVLLTLEIGARQKSLEDNIAVYQQLATNVYQLQDKVKKLTPYAFNRIKNKLNDWLGTAKLPLWQEDEKLSKFENYKSLIKKSIATQKQKNDGEGNLIAQDWRDQGKVYERDKEGRPLKAYSSLVEYAYDPDYYFNEVALPARDVQKAYETYFAPTSVPFDILDYNDEQLKMTSSYYRLPNNPFVDALYEKYNSELVVFAEKLKEMESPEFQSNLIRDIEERMQSMRVDTKDLNKVVADFGKLNYLLSDKRVTIQPSEVANVDTTPSVEVGETEKSGKDILIENIQLMKELLSIIDDKAGRKAIMNDIKDTQELLKLM
jgi:hypothetical protein